MVQYNGLRPEHFEPRERKQATHESDLGIIFKLVAWCRIDVQFKNNVGAIVKLTTRHSCIIWRWNTVVEPSWQSNVRREFAIQYMAALCTISLGELSPGRVGHFQATRPLSCSSPEPPEFGDSTSHPQKCAVPKAQIPQ